MDVLKGKKIMVWTFMGNHGIREGRFLTSDSLCQRDRAALHVLFWIEVDIKPRRCATEVQKDNRFFRADDAVEPHGSVLRLLQTDLGVRSIARQSGTFLQLKVGKINRAGAILTEVGYGLFFKNAGESIAGALRGQDQVHHRPYLHHEPEQSVMVGTTVTLTTRLSCFLFTTSARRMNLTLPIERPKHGIQR